jgi:hypothetical protein
MSGSFDVVDPNEDASQPPTARPQVRIRGSADLTGSLRSLALVLRLLLAAEIMLDIALVPALLNQRSAVLGVVGGSASLADVRGADHLANRLSNASVGAVLLIAVVFLVWFYRARGNVEYYEPRFQRRSIGWSLGGWLPVVNIWVPYQVATDILLDSDQPLTGPARSKRRAYGLVRAWWLMWVVRFGLMVATRLADSSTPHAFANYDLISVAYQTADLVAAVLLLLVIDLITTAQHQRRMETLTAFPA